MMIITKNDLEFSWNDADPCNPANYINSCKLNFRSMY